MGPMRSALILVENDSVPADTRVWAECLSLRRAGWDVTVVSPTGCNRDTETFSDLSGVQIHRFDPFRSASTAGYFREYGRALLRMSALVRRLSRTRRFDVVHACNPPDFLLLAAVALRRRGAAMIFDHHDLSPELYLAKYGRGGATLRALRIAERLGLALADVVLATNESFRTVAIERGRKAAGDVFVVRNGPDTNIFRPTEPERDVHAGAKHVIGYVGVFSALFTFLDCSSAPRCSREPCVRSRIPTAARAGTR